MTIRFTGVSRLLTGFVFAAIKVTLALMTALVGHVLAQQPRQSRPAPSIFPPQTACFYFTETVNWLNVSKLEMALRMITVIQIYTQKGARQLSLWPLRGPIRPRLPLDLPPFTLQLSCSTV